MGKLGLSAKLSVFSFITALVPILVMGAISAFAMHKFYESSVASSAKMLGDRAEADLYASAKVEGELVSEFISHAALSAGNFASSQNVLEYIDALGQDTADVRTASLSEARRCIQSAMLSCQVQQGALESAISANLAVANELLSHAGGLGKAQGSLLWKAKNQFSGEVSELELPALAIGSLPLGQNASFEQPSPVVDKLSSLAGKGTSCTIFQRMNEKGDMLRVATSVKQLDGSRAIGTFIPSVNPDGKPNPVIASVLKGETYLGRAYVVNSWCITSYKPLKDADGKISGMLYVGIKEQGDERLVSNILSTRTPEMDVYVIDGNGDLVIGGKPELAGKPAAAALARPFLSKVPSLAEAGKIGSEVVWVDGKPHCLAWSSFPHWNWIICADVSMDGLALKHAAEHLDILKLEISSLYNSSFIKSSTGEVKRYLTQVRVFDAKGMELAVMKNGVFDSKLGSRSGVAWYDSGLKLKKGSVAFSKLEISLNTKQAELRIFAPVYIGEAIAGLAVFNLDWDAVSALIGRDKPGIGGYFFMVDQDGFLISHPKFSLKDKKNVFEGQDVDKSLAAALKAGTLEQRSGLARYMLDGSEKIVSFEPLKIGEFKYSIAAAVDLKECLSVVANIEKTAGASSRHAMMLVAVAFVAISAMALLCGSFFGHLITGPLKRLAGALRDESAQVQTASSQISGASGDLADGASKQAASIETISSSLTEISSMLKRSSENAASAEKLSDEAEEATKGGIEAMQSLSTAMGKIKGSAEETAKIAKTIEEIAFQTNLLALNAAVEAARAGDAGRGFAVVAEEVRHLAQRSAEAARESSRLLEESKASSEEGVKANGLALERIGSIKSAFDKVSALVDEISASSKEQAQGIEQISDSVNDLESVTQANAASSQETAASAAQLELNATQLDDAVVSLTHIVEGGEFRQGLLPQGSDSPALRSAPAAGGSGVKSSAALKPASAPRPKLKS